MDDPVRISGDFDDAVRQYWPRVFRFALVSLRDRGAAESVTQDVFLRAYKAWETFRGESSISTWLMQIAVNHIRDRARNRRLQFWRSLVRSDAKELPGLLVADNRPSPEMSLAARQRIDAVWKAAAELPERQRTVFMLRFVEDMDLLEIAAVTGLAEGTVKAHLFRALQTVRAKTKDIQ
jgi:RNA polymerase sigma-70 factor (ECF subfamily)